MGIKVVLDSGSDIGKSFLANNSDIIHLEGCIVTKDGVDYTDDFGVKFDIEEFYQDLRSGSRASTAMVSPQRWEKVFTEFTSEGHEVIYLGFSSQLSSVHNSAIIAMNTVVGINPDAKIHMIDTVSASVGQALLARICVEKIRMGEKAADITEYIKGILQNANHWFAVDDLNYLKRGGRISTAVAMIGTALQLKPVLTVNPIGQIVPAGKTRGRKKSIQNLADKAKTLFQPEIYNRILIGHSGCIEDAQTLRGIVSGFFPDTEIIIQQMCITITTHVGPGSLAIGFIGKERKQGPN